MCVLVCTCHRACLLVRVYVPIMATLALIGLSLTVMEINMPPPPPPPVQGARRHYAREVRIKIDFSGLPESLKRARGHDAIAKKADELHRECISLRASLEKYAGADLKASDRLKEVEDRLRMASDDMDSARKEFSKRKRAFDVVAKARCVDEWVVDTVHSGVSD